MTNSNLFNEIYYSTIDPPPFILMKKCGFCFRSDGTNNFRSDLKFHFRHKILTRGYRLRLQIIPLPKDK